MNKTVLLLLVFIVLTINTFAQSEFRVGQKTLSFNDSARQRPLKTEIWYPTEDNFKDSDLNVPIPFKRVNTVRDGAVIDERLPLIMLSHGFGGGRITLEWLAAALAQKGFIVAAVDHWGNTYDNLIIERSVEYFERPKDISFVLTELLKSPEFKDSIDEKRIGAAGFSIGGFTVIALAGGQLNADALIAYFKSPRGQAEAKIPEIPSGTDLTITPAITEYYKNTSPDVKDKRIRAVFAIAPAAGQGFTSPEQFSQVDIPVYIVGGESDPIAPMDTNAGHYHQLIKNSKYMVFDGKVKHYTFLNEATEELTKQMPVYYGDDASISRAEIHQKTADLAVKFFSRELK